ncbi:hypothetical protein [Muricoccus aerilatus]|uniref:hypothetical protein n=1 Tax=Muricoccus aerilatus TaxID=452982 RepID=UPI0012EC1678|nr:hypothetical protein [Roseomonas aerilata]
MDFLEGLSKFPIWHPPPSTKPSPTYLGEERHATIFLAVGQAVNEWERFELQMAILFRTFCEAESRAAQRAYGTIFGALGKGDAITAAATEFFRRRSSPNSDDAAMQEEDKTRLKKLLKAHTAAAAYRNNIAHGMVWEMRITRSDGTTASGGLYLCASPQTTKKLELPDSALSTYYYRAAEIQHCTKRFSELAYFTLDLAARIENHYLDPAKDPQE